MGRVLVSHNPLMQTRGGGGGVSTSVECLFSMTPLPRAARADRVPRGFPVIGGDGEALLFIDSGDCAVRSVPVAGRGREEEELK